MASTSSFLSRNWSYNVFTSFHGPDVRKTLLSHMQKQFKCKGITMFDDQKIKRSQEISPSLRKAIRESRISIVILSEKYASSSWCLDELLEILKCKKVMGQIVMTIFYGVEPSDVRKQTGEFGITFNKTCARMTDEKRHKWSKALNDVGNIAGEDFLKWDNEAKMIEKIAKDVSDQLNATPSRDFDGMVGLEAHLRVMESLLDLDYDGVKMVAITGHAGIGKTTIARALQSRVSSKFQLTCFVDNLRGSYLSGLDELRLQEQFLSNILNQDGIKICHSGVIEERLCKQRVLIILDDVNNINQLKALANDTSWFGPGSRIVVTTENKELLKQHGIDNIYHVGFPSDEEAVKILCRYAFKQTSPRHGFKELAKSVTELCGKLPLGLRVVGSSLQGKDEDEWTYVMRRLETILDRDIEDILSVGYESLDKDEQTLFLHIAVFFNKRDGNLVKSMFADSDLDVKHGLKILEHRSLIEISEYRKTIKMHRLLQQMGRNAIHKQEPWKRQILMDAHEICDVLEDAKGTRNVAGISFDISSIDELSISKKAFKRMPNLLFLRVYKSKDGNNIVIIPDEMEFPCRLRLLHWEAYPSKCLPPKFRPEYLVELDMQDSQLEKLWGGGAQVLTNLKKMDLFRSKNLKELPDLSNARNLEILNLICCVSLVEIPSSCIHLHKLHRLLMNNCRNLEAIPPHMNLASLEQVTIAGCYKLRNIPVMSTNITNLYVADTLIQDLTPSIRLCSRLEFLSITSCGNFNGLTHLPTSVRSLDLSRTNIERIPDCIKDLHRLEDLSLSRCRRLTSLPELPPSLSFLSARDCESLETVSFPLNIRVRMDFTNCFKLCEQARRAIIQHLFRSNSCYYRSNILPGKEVPADFDHRGTGNSLIIPPDVNRPYRRFLVCVVISHNQQFTGEYDFSALMSRPIDRSDLDPVDGVIFVDSSDVATCRREHLLMFDSGSPFKGPSRVSREIVFEFSSKLHSYEIIECGVKILAYKNVRSMQQCRI